MFNKKQNDDFMQIPTTISTGIPGADPRLRTKTVWKQTPDKDGRSKIRLVVSSNAQKRVRSVSPHQRHDEK